MIKMKSDTLLFKSPVGRERGRERERERRKKRVTERGKLQRRGSATEKLNPPLQMSVSELQENVRLEKF